MGRNQTPRKSRKKAPVTSAARTRAVFFDAGNTLLRAHPSVGHIYTRVARRHGVWPKVREIESRFLSAWKARHGVEYLKSDRAEKVWWQKMVHRVMGDHFPNTLKFRRYFEDLYSQFAHPAHWRYFDDALPTLRALRKRGYRLGVVSNWDTRLVTLAERMGLNNEVEFVLVSSVEKLVKPDARLFQRALDRANVAPGEAVHVGDSLHEDYHGAENAGLTGLLLDRHGQAPEGVRAIKSLKEILRFIQTQNENFATTSNRRRRS